MMTFSSLDLGAPRDGLSWNRGCKDRLGMKPKTSIISGTPTMAQLVEFFGRDPDWIYLSGHFSARTLFNNENVVPAVDILFREDGVDIKIGADARQLRRSDGEFQLHQECTLVIWGGCSALQYEFNVQLFRRLFDNPVLLGYAGGTGWQINDAMLGGGFITNDFFARVRNKMAQNDRFAVRNAWMETAAWGYGGGDCGDIFRAVDQDGQEWKLSGKRIVMGRKY